MISNNEDIRCGWCRKSSKLKEWDDLTFSRCTNREMKRCYTKLSNEKAFLRKSDTYYMCPKCKSWSRGSQLRIINTDDLKLKNLGGEPIIWGNMINDEKREQIEEKLAEDNN